MTQITKMLDGMVAADTAERACDWAYEHAAHAYMHVTADWPLWARSAVAAAVGRHDMPGAGMLDICTAAGNAAYEHFCSTDEGIINKIAADCARITAERREEGRAYNARLRARERAERLAAASAARQSRR